MPAISIEYHRALKTTGNARVTGRGKKLTNILWVQDLMIVLEEEVRFNYNSLN